MLMFSKTCPVCKHESLQYTGDTVICTNCHTYQKPLNFLQTVIQWTRGKWWWWRLPIIVWFAVMLKQNLGNHWFAINRTSNPFSALDLGIHELGHILFSPFGQFIYIAGGSLFQCLFPLMGVIGFIQKKWYFASAMCWCWFGLNLFDVATYADDARARLLPLVTGLGGLGEQGSDEAYDRAHDWYQLLSRTNHLGSDHAIAHGLRVAAVISMLSGMALGVFLLLNMIFRKRQPELAAENLVSAVAAKD
jgi:hypothetical protein